MPDPAGSLQRESGVHSAAILEGLALVYVGLLLNQHFTRFLVYFPVLMGLIWAFGLFRKEVAWQNPLTLLPRMLQGAIIAYVLALGLASTISPMALTALKGGAGEVVGPLVVAMIAGGVARKSGGLQRLLLAAAFGCLFLAFTDVAHYARDIWTNGHLPSDYSHRWFAEGYIFYLPFLLVARERVPTKLRLAANGFVGLVFLLAAMTAGRAAWGCVLLEVVLVGVFIRRRLPAADTMAFLAAVALSIVILPEAIGEATLERGFSDNNRIRGHWIPAVQMIFDSTHWLLGYGFGREVWDVSLAAAENVLYKGPGVGGPHNVFLQAWFAGGVACLIALSVLFIELYRALRPCRWCGDSRSVLIAARISFVVLYLVAGMVGDPRFEPVAVFLMVAMWAARQCNGVAPA